jgi:prephenate dehydratase
MARGCVAYQGAPGSFSHEACAVLRPWDEAICHETFDTAIRSVHDGRCECALIPVENSQIGDVQPARRLVDASGLDVLAEVWRPIRLALMAPRGARLSDLRTVESHLAALGQCVGTLASLKLDAVEAFDTAGAARAVSEAEDPTRAALAPAGAAEIYGLSILRNDMQDSADNRTRFVLLGRKGA